MELIGLELEYDKPTKPDFGFKPKFDGDRVFVQSVELDRSAYQDGLNAGDEIIAINRMRIDRTSFNQLDNYLVEGEAYELEIARLGYLQTISISPKRKDRHKIKAIKVKNQSLAPLV